MRIDHTAITARNAAPFVAFAALVAWMTPPTTPHPSAPSPLLAFKNIRSEADIRASATAKGDGGFFYGVPAYPWWATSSPAASPFEGAPPRTPASYKSARKADWQSSAEVPEEDAEAPLDDEWSTQDQTLPAFIPTAVRTAPAPSRLPDATTGQEDGLADHVGEPPSPGTQPTLSTLLRTEPPASD